MIPAINGLVAYWWSLPLGAEFCRRFATHLPIESTAQTQWSKRSTQTATPTSNGRRHASTVRVTNRKYSTSAQAVRSVIRPNANRRRAALSRPNGIAGHGALDSIGKAVCGRVCPGVSHPVAAATVSITVGYTPPRSSSRTASPVFAASSDGAVTDRTVGSGWRDKDGNPNIMKNKIAASIKQAVRTR